MPKLCPLLIPAHSVPFEVIYFVLTQPRALSCWNVLQSHVTGLIFFFFPGWSRLDDWLLDRMASCQHLLFPALSERSRQLVESSWQPATALEDQGESLEWSLMFPMEVCDSKYTLIIMISSILCYHNPTMAPWWQTDSVEGIAQKYLVRCLYKSGISRETQPIGYKKIYFKESAHVFMVAEKSQDLQLASWRPRRANGKVLTELKGLRHSRADGVNSCWVWVWRQEGWKCQLEDNQIERASSVDWMKPTTCLLIQIIRKHPHRHTWNNVLSNIWALCGPVTFTHEMNDHNAQNGRTRKWHNEILSPFGLLSPWTPP